MRRGSISLTPVLISFFSVAAFLGVMWFAMPKEGSETNTINTAACTALIKICPSGDELTTTTPCQFAACPIRAAETWANGATYTSLDFNFQFQRGDGWQMERFVDGITFNGLSGDDKPNRIQFTAKPLAVVAQSLQLTSGTDVIFDDQPAKIFRPAVATDPETWLVSYANGTFIFTLFPDSSEVNAGHNKKVLTTFHRIDPPTQQTYTNTKFHYTFSYPTGIQTQPVDQAPHIFTQEDTLALADADAIGLIEGDVQDLFGVRVFSSEAEYQQSFTEGQLDRVNRYDATQEVVNGVTWNRFDFNVSQAYRYGPIYETQHNGKYYRISMPQSSAAQAMFKSFHFTD